MPAQSPLLSVRPPGFVVRRIVDVIEVPSHSGCPFCDYLNGAVPCSFVLRNERVSAFMNRAQYERGALLIVPNSHHETILELAPELVFSIYSEAQRIAGGMVKVFGAVGVNVFNNSGVRAGQTVSHFHVHIVPRYESSEPWKRFHTDDFEHTPVDELENIAAELRIALSA